MFETSLYSTTRVTLELREVVDNGVDLWKFDYPSYYKGEEKKAFEQKVIDHFYLRQIGSETVGRFLHQFRSRVREIMPRYIELYKTVEIMHGLEDPFGNVDIVETYEETTGEQTTGSGETGSTSKTSSSSESASTATGSSSETSEGSESRDNTEDREHRFSNTPQGSISNIDNYLTEASKDHNVNEESLERSSSSSSENSSEATGSSSDETSATGSTNYTETGSKTGTVSHTLRRKGNQGVNTYAHDMIEFRQAIIDVDMMIIDDLNCLFLGIY